MSSEATATSRFGAEAGPRPDAPVPKLRRLEIRNLGKWYGNAAALRSFDLDVHGGEFISLLGPSGCGKTTALHCIAGLLEPDEGTIELDGRDLTGLPPERRGFGMVFQNYALFPHLTVGRNVAFGLEMMGVRREEIARRVTEALRLVQLADLADRHPSQLSGGQQQRVALARAIVTEPRLLLMDEPLSNLDARLRVEMRTEIRRLHQSLGLTTLYVTHDQEEALSLSDRIVLLRGGVIQQVGTPEEVYGEPRSSYVAGFLGYRNLIPVTVVERGPDGVTVALPGGPRLPGTPRGDLEAQREAIAAVRPEDVEILPPDTAGPNVLRARVELAEFVGNGFESSADVGGGLRLIARTPRRWPPGSAVALRVPRGRLLVFPRE